MPYLKSSQITGLSPKPLDVTGFTQSDTEILDGTYSQHEVLLADNYNIKGDVTISDNLILAKLSDDGNAITLTGDSTTRTIAGSGSLEGSTFAQTPNASMTGMTGAIGSAVTGTLGSEIVFPTGHTLQTVHSASGDSYQTGGGSSNVFGNVTITNPNVVITPRDASNKILLLCHACVHPAAHSAVASIYRNSASTTETHNLPGCTHGAAQIQGDQTHTITWMWIDTPGYVEAITYRMTWRATGTSQVCYFGNGGATTRNTITAIEIEA